jgi:hypothetical protein
MADNVRVESEFGTAADLARVPFDANPTGLPCRDKHAIFRLN